MTVPDPTPAPLSHNEAETQVAAIARAKALGYRYLPADEVARLPLGELLSRIETLMEIGTDQTIDQIALLGGVSNSDEHLARLSGRDPLSRARAILQARSETVT